MNILEKMNKIMAEVNEAKAESLKKGKNSMTYVIDQDKWSLSDDEMEMIESIVSILGCEVRKEKVETEVKIVYDFEDQEMIDRYIEFLSKAIAGTIKIQLRMLKGVFGAKEESTQVSGYGATVNTKDGMNAGLQYLIDIMLERKEVKGGSKTLDMDNTDMDKVVQKAVKESVERLLKEDEKARGLVDKK